jgi:hypothetical protein
MIPRVDAKKELLNSILSRFKKLGHSQPVNPKGKFAVILAAIVGFSKSKIRNDSDDLGSANDISGNLPGVVLHASGDGQTLDDSVAQSQFQSHLGFMDILKIDGAETIGRNREGLNILGAMTETAKGNIPT